MPSLPLWSIVTPGAWAQPARADAAILQSVPVGASIQTDIGLMSYLVDDRDVYWIGNTSSPPGCILIDRTAGGPPGDRGDVLDVAALLHPETSYRLISQTSGYELACAG